MGWKLCALPRDLGWDLIQGISLSLPIPLSQLEGELQPALHTDSALRAIERKKASDSQQNAPP